jgi:hypothetical protein
MQLDPITHSREGGVPARRASSVACLTLWFVTGDELVERRRYFTRLIADDLRRLSHPTEWKFELAKQRRLPAHGDDPDAMIVGSVMWSDVQAVLRER